MPATGEIMTRLIRLPADPDGCWLWLGKVHPTTGYGCKQLAGKTLLAHRWAYNISVGLIEDGAVIDHRCGNRQCVNPRHMEVVSQAVNVRRGAGCKLTDDQVAEIKAAIPGLRWGGRKRLAARYGVSPALISDIKYGRAWQDVAPADDRRTA